MRLVWASVTTMLSNQQLSDALIRQSMYVEGVKLNEAAQFRKVLRKTYDEFEKLLPRNKYETLDGMTKAELNTFIAKLRKSQMSIYNDWTQKIIDQLKAFMRAHLKVSKQIMASVKSEAEVASVKQADVQEEENKSAGLLIPLFGWAILRIGKSDSLWSKLVNSPIPANGATIDSFAKSLSLSAQVALENHIRKAYANKLTPKQTMDELTGQAGMLDRMSNNGSAVIDTLIQHIAQTVSAAVQSAYFEKYEWVSIMDNRTTNTCRNLDGKRFKYGAGPLPPAHIRCRSHITAVPIDWPGVDETYGAWMKRQPKDVINDLVTRSALDKFRADKELTPEEYADKLPFILQR